MSGEPRQTPEREGRYRRGGPLQAVSLGEGEGRGREKQREPFALHASLQGAVEEYVTAEQGVIECRGNPVRPLRGRGGTGGGVHFGGWRPF